MKIYKIAQGMFNVLELDDEIYNLAIQRLKSLVNKLIRSSKNQDSDSFIFEAGSRLTQIYLYHDKSLYDKVSVSNVPLTVNLNLSYGNSPMANGAYGFNDGGNHIDINIVVPSKDCLSIFYSSSFMNRLLEVVSHETQHFVQNMVNIKLESNTPKYHGFPKPFDKEKYKKYYDQDEELSARCAGLLKTFMEKLKKQWTERIKNGTKIRDIRKEIKSQPSRDVLMALIKWMDDNGQVPENSDSRQKILKSIVKNFLKQREKLYRLNNWTSNQTAIRGLYPLDVSIQDLVAGSQSWYKIAQAWENEKHIDTDENDEMVEENDISFKELFNREDIYDAKRSLSVVAVCLTCGLKSHIKNRTKAFNSKFENFCSKCGFITVHFVVHKCH